MARLTMARLTKATLTVARPTLARLTMARLTMAMLTLLSMGYEVLVDGCFNADPHPGNILYLAKTEQLGLIDYGQVKRLTELERLNCAKVRHALCQATSHSASHSAPHALCAAVPPFAAWHPDTRYPRPPAPRASRYCLLASATASHQLIAARGSYTRLGCAARGD